MLLSRYVLLSFQLGVFSVSYGVAGSLSNGNSFSNHDQNDTKTYDYIIVGGGLTGLVVANRLTEDSESQLQPATNFKFRIH